MRRREGERLSCDGATVRRRDWDLRVWGFERGRDEWGLRVIENWEMRNEGFRRVILREAEQRRIGGKKKCWSCFRTTPFREKKKKESGRRRLRLKESEPSEPVTVHRTRRSDRGPDGSMLFSHGTVPYLKPTVNLNGSQVFRSDRTVRSRFNNLALSNSNT